MRTSSIQIFLGFTALILVVQSSVLKAAGAGVLVSTFHNNQVYVLLADHKKPNQIARGWSTLGGTIKEGESELQAAVREVVEESNGVLSAELLFSQLDPKVKTATPNFTIFYARIPFLSTEEFNRSQDSDENDGNSERGPFIWLPWKDILSAEKTYRLQQNSTSQPRVFLDKRHLTKSSQTDWFFNVFLETVKKISDTSGTQLSEL